MASGVQGSAMKTLERAILWPGGAVFVGSLRLLRLHVCRRRGEPARAVRRLAPIWHRRRACFTVFARHHSVFARDPRRSAGWRTWFRNGSCDRSTSGSRACCSIARLRGVAAGRRRALPRATAGRRLALAAVQLAGVLAHRARRQRRSMRWSWPAFVRIARWRALQVRGPYRWVRHPLYLGWLLVVFGAGPHDGRSPDVRGDLDVLSDDRRAVGGTLARSRSFGRAQYAPLPPARAAGGSCLTCY